MTPWDATAIVAALHLTVLAARVPHRTGWRMAIPGVIWHSADSASTESPIAEEPPSNPRQIFCVGQIDLSRGMAVVALAFWLHIMQINGSRGY